MKADVNDKTDDRDVFPWRIPEFGPQMIIPFLSISKQKFRNSTVLSKTFQIKRKPLKGIQSGSTEKKYQKCVGGNLKRNGEDFDVTASYSHFRSECLNGIHRFDLVVFIPSYKRTENTSYMSEVAYLKFNFKRQCSFISSSWVQY